MKLMRIFLAVLLWLFTFTIAYANIRVNEVAWMGTSVSGTNEWIELLNEGDMSIDLAGWSIVALDGSPSIVLSGSVAPRGYFLIERTDDTTVPDITADQVAPFGSGLANAGETLYLKDPNGAIVDTIISGSDWASIGGDNTTKETAQYTSSGWVTGVPTPRAANVAHGEVLGASTVTPPSVTVTGVQAPNMSSGGVTSVLATPTYPRKEISVFAGDDKSALVYTPVLFSGTSYGLYDESLPYATYRWNFGDGASAEGREVSHAYNFPGEYTASLEVFWGEEHKTRRLHVSVSSVDIIVGKVSSGVDGFVELLNQSDQEIDLSLWQLRTPSGATFTIPRNTFIAKGQPVRLPNAITNLLDPSSGLELMYPDGRIIFASLDAAQSNISAIPLQKPQALSLSVPPQAMIAGVTASVPKEKEGASQIDSASAPIVLWQGSEEGNRSNIVGINKMSQANMKWIFLVMVILLVVFAGFVISRSNEENSIASEYAIVEDIIEGEEDLAKD